MPRPAQLHEEGRPQGRRRRLSPAVGAARNAVRAALEEAGIPVGSPPAPVVKVTGEGPAADAFPTVGSQLPVSRPPLVLVACSGGPDSLALAAATAFFARRGDIRAGAVIVDHQLQAGSGEVAAATAQALTGLGLDPVEVTAVTVRPNGLGPEAAAREVRYAAFMAAVERHEAGAVLLGHTLGDQAESVLLGLARGSGTRSLAGIPARRGPYVRPLLGLHRAETEAICAAEGLTPWQDPSNADPALMRSRVRTRVLPFLEQHLGPGIADALSRSAGILSADAEYLDGLALERFRELAVIETGEILLPLRGLEDLPPALRHRVIALAAIESGAEHPSMERIHAVERLLQRSGSAGPVQLVGKVEVFRQRRRRTVPAHEPDYGSLSFKQMR